jgi:hypothetical protein
MWTLSRIALVLAALAAIGCAAGQPYQARSTALVLPPVVAYQNSTGSLSYQSPTGKDVGGVVSSTRVEGRACQSGLQFPVGLIWALADSSGNGAQALALSAGWGAGGYSQAMARAQAQAPNGVLYDVEADLNVQMILGIWRHECVVVNAAVASPVLATSVAQPVLPAQPVPPAQPPAAPAPQIPPP